MLAGLGSAAIAGIAGCTNTTEQSETAAESQPTGGSNTTAPVAAVDEQGMTAIQQDRLQAELDSLPTNE